MKDQRLLELIAKKQAGEISPMELIELNKLINEDPSNSEWIGLLEKIWDTPLDTEQEITAAQVKERWNRSKERLSGVKNHAAMQRSKPARIITLVKYAAVAACVVLAVSVTTWWLMNRSVPGTPAHNNVITTRNGSHSRVTLPDGTAVWLNAGSDLTYNESFGKNTRDVQLTGEAFFEVTKDAARPFIIHTKTMNVKVLGTVFNVRAYPNEKTTEAALLKGSIEISLAARPTDRIILKPTEKIAVRNDDPQLMKKAGSANAGDNDEQAANPAITVSKISYDRVDSTVIETSWVKNKLIFRNKPFEELTRDMERWYNVTITINDDDLAQKRFTGTFYNESVQEALDKLKVSYPFHYQYNKKNNTITIE
jgi:transmembrane sensor